MEQKQKFFALVPPKPSIPFVGISKITLWVSIFVLAAFTVLLMSKGLNYGVDFKGGSQMHLKFKDGKSASEIRSALVPAGFSEATVQEFGEAGENEFLVRVPPEDKDLKLFEKQIKAAIEQGVGQAPSIRFGNERMYLTFEYAVEPKQISETIESLSEADLSVESVDRFGSSENFEYWVRLSGVSTRVLDALETSFGESSFDVLQTDQVGAKVGKQLRLQAIGAVLISVFLILIYIWFRFDIEFAPGAILALVHDSVFVLGIFSLLNLQFDLSIVAAVLTIVGFSINDTIVVYDRVRENLANLRSRTFSEVINMSINETLSRTLLTSGTLFLACIALWVFGGPITRNFAIAFTIGVVVGTYSSIFIASPLTIEFRKYLMGRAKQ